MVPIVNRLRQTQVCGVALRHISKTVTTALHAGVGSVGYAALARSIISVGVDAEDESLHYFANARANYAKHGATWAFRIDGVMLPGFVRPQGRVAWVGESDKTATQVVAPGRVNVGATAAARALLQRRVTRPTRSPDVYQYAEIAGISKATLNRAAGELGMARKNLGFGADSRWWFVPAPVEQWGEADFFEGIPLDFPAAEPS